jgi:cytochrome c oxidase assembly factor CtaG/putative copper export protein
VQLTDGPDLDSAMSTVGRAKSSRRPSTTWVTVASVFLALAVCALTMQLTGAAHVLRLPGLPAPDETTPWLLPLVRLVGRLAEVATVGFLMAAALFLPGESGALSPQSWLAQRRAALSAGVWAITQVLLIPLTAGNLLGVSAWSLNVNRVISTIRQVETGQVLLLDTALAIACAAVARFSMRRSGAIAGLVISVIAVVPQAASGHASASGDHQLAVSGLLLHLLGILTWVGGLAAIVLMSRSLDTVTLRNAARRFSAIAAPAAAIVLLSGLLEAELRLGFAPSRWLSTNYGLVVMAKIVATVLLLIIGARHRQYSLRQLDAGRRSGFLRLAIGECLLFAITLGLATALGRTAPPSQNYAPTEAETLLGFPMPAPLTWSRVVFDWYPEPVFLTAGIVAIWLYLAGVRRLRSQGTPWPWVRILTWLSGWVLIVFAMCSGLARYAPVLAWVHMTQHLLLAMYAAPLLVLSAPVTLALRAIKPSPDPNLPGPREALLGCLHSRLSKILTQPAVALCLFAGSTFAFYMSGLYGLALRSHVAHMIVSADFLIVGYLFYYAIIGIDPGPTKTSPPVRLFILLIAAVAHTVFGVALMASSGALAGDWFAVLNRPWGPSAVSDTQTAGGVAWTFGELPTMVILLVFVLNWAKTDEREQRRRDRAADIKGSAESDAIEDYNAMLTRLADRDHRTRV